MSADKPKMTELSREALEAIGQRGTYTSALPIEPCRYVLLTTSERGALVAVALAYQDALSEVARLQAERDAAKATAENATALWLEAGTAWADKTAELLAEKERLTAALSRLASFAISLAKGYSDIFAQRVILDAEAARALLAEIEVVKEPRG